MPRNCEEGPPIDALDSTSVLTGTLHLFVAFDWGEEVDLERARGLVPADFHALPRRRRTPSSIDFQPPPLRSQLAPLPLELPELGTVQTRGETAIFDFAAVSVGFHVPFQLSVASLVRLAGWLAEPAPVVQAARTALEPLYQSLLPAIERPDWAAHLSEEYFVFHFPPGAPLDPAPLLQSSAGWLAQLLRLEAGPLSGEEIANALRLHLSYTPHDLFVPDWASAILIDSDCDETLQTIEFTNLQLLEYRHIDKRLDGNLAATYRTMQDLSRSWLPFWRTHSRQLRTVGELKIEANEVFERTGNVLKLVGDQYLARVYRQLATRFHLQEWQRSIERKLEVIEGIYQVLSDQAATYRTEFLEAIVVFLIVIEVVLALMHR